MTEPVSDDRTPLVLLADDDEAARLLIEFALTDANLRVVQAQDGKEAVDAFLRERPDIVLLDVNMPVMDGYEACRTLRTLPGGESVPILMVTGHEDIQSITSAYEAGATDFLSKSSNWAIVAHRVRYMLRAARALAEAEKTRKILSSAQRIARIGGWEWRADSDRLLLSRELRDMLGLEAGDDEISRERYMNAVHPDDRKRIREATVAALRNVRPYNVIHRVIFPDGSQRCLHARAEVDFDPAGRAVRMFGTVQDQTDRLTNWRTDHFDSLTGLPNRVMFRDQLSRAIAGCARTEQRLAVMFLGLDQFKGINDAYGHAVGDRALAAAAERIAACVRGSEAVSRGPLDDPAGGELHEAAQQLLGLGRPGGDEFCLFLANVGEPGNAAKVARRILAKLARPMVIGRHELAVGASIGIAMYPTDGENSETLLRNAKAATYQAKEGGRNNYRFFASAMNAEAFHRLSLENALRKAVDNGEFVLHYQPVVSFTDGEVVGAEALIRWQHPELGLVLPAEFLALAEETGLIIPISEWVLEHACRQAAAWRDLTPSPLKISVNVSAVHFRHHAILQSVNRALQSSALDARQLTLELPESTLMRDAETTLGMLRQLAEIGSAPVCRQFRRRLFLLHVPAPLSAALGQDRPLIRARPSREPGCGGDRARDRRHGPYPYAHRGGRGRRDAGSASIPARTRLPGVPGLPVQSGSAGRKARGVAAAQTQAAMNIARAIRARAFQRQGEFHRRLERAAASLNARRAWPRDQYRRRHR